MVEKEQLAQMTLDELKQFKSEVMEQRYAMKDRVAELNTEIGKRILARKKSELEKVRREYNEIKVLGQNPQDVILKLHLCQSRERFLSKDIEDIEKPKKVVDLFDKQLTLCNNIRQLKEKKSQMERK